MFCPISPAIVRSHYSFSLSRPWPPSPFLPHHLIEAYPLVIRKRLRCKSSSFLPALVLDTCILPLLLLPLVSASAVFLRIVALISHCTYFTLLTTILISLDVNSQRCVSSIRLLYRKEAVRQHSRCNTTIPIILPQLLQLCPAAFLLLGCESQECPSLTIPKSHHMPCMASFQTSIRPPPPPPFPLSPFGSLVLNFLPGPSLLT